MRSCCELRIGWDSRARLNGRRVTGGEAPSPFRACQKYISQAGSVSRAASVVTFSPVLHKGEPARLMAYAMNPGDRSELDFGVMKSY